MSEETLKLTPEMLVPRLGEHLRKSADWTGSFGVKNCHQRNA